MMSVTKKVALLALAASSGASAFAFSPRPAGVGSVATSSRGAPFAR